MTKKELLNLNYSQLVDKLLEKKDEKGCDWCMKVLKYYHNNKGSLIYKVKDVFEVENEFAPARRTFDGRKVLDHTWQIPT